MHAKSLTPSLVLALAVLALAGCGGGSPQTGGRVRAQVDVVCKATPTSVGGVRTSSLTAPKLAADVGKARRKLRDVDAPKGVAADYARYLTLLERERSALAARKAARARDLEAQANDLAAALDLQRCRQPRFERGSSAK